MRVIVVHVHDHYAIGIIILVHSRISASFVVVRACMQDVPLQAGSWVCVLEGVKSLVLWDYDAGSYGVAYHR